MILKFIIASFAGAARAAQNASLPVIDLGYVVQQATLNSSGTYPLLTFSNIRFGESPTSALRFAAPIPPQSTNRTINNGQQPVICPQAFPSWQLSAFYLVDGITPPAAPAATSSPSLSEIVASIPAPSAGTSEDCLFLDVVVPEIIYNSTGAKAARAYQNDASTGAPVLVWIAGGGYVLGDKKESGAYDPASLLARSLENGKEGVIYVAPNYRLGAFGWQASAAFQAQGGTANAGLLDQRLALEWVQKYIHLFGGDPSRVTIMGESAGGGAIVHHITAPASFKTSSLFTQAIPQSPAFQPVVNSQQTETYMDTLKYASLLTNKTITTLAQLKALPFEVLYNANYLQIAKSPYGQYTFGPAVDGSYVPDLPGKRFQSGNYDPAIKVMTAHTANEGKFFTSAAIQNDTAVTALLQSFIPDASQFTIEFVSTILYPPIFDGSYPWTTQHERGAKIVEEFIIVCNSYFLAKAFAPDNSWKYQFSVPPAVHGDDLSYTFFNGDTSTANFLGGGTTNATVARVLQDWIVDFVATGTPNGVGVTAFSGYGSGVGNVVDLNVTRLGDVLPDVDENARCLFWQEAAWTWF